MAIISVMINWLKQELFLPCCAVTSLQNYLLMVKFIYANVPGKIVTFTID